MPRMSNSATKKFVPEAAHADVESGPPPLEDDEPIEPPPRPSASNRTVKFVRISEAELKGETGRVSEGKRKSKRKHKSDLEAANSSDEPSEPPHLNAAEDDDDVPDHPPPPANEGENEMDLDNDTIPAPSDVEAGTGGVGERRGMAVRRQRKAILLAPLGHTNTKTKARIESLSSKAGGGSLHSPSERVKSARNIKEKVKNTLAALGASRFEKWTSDELILTLIQGGIEVRNESVVDHGTLVGLVESLYDGKEMPEKVAPYLQHELEKIEWVVRKIQNLFIERSAIHRAEDERHTLFQRPDPSDISASYTELNLNDALEDDDEPYDYEDGGDGEKHWFANPIKVNKAGRTYERKRVDNPKREEDEHTGRETEFEFRASEFDGSLLVSGARERRAPKSRSVKILDIPWHAPSWTKAEEHMNYNRPRQGGKGGQRFHFKTTTTGRHCSLGGCGEMCDLFREGQVSEFGIFGPGVTNYFKFTKWLFWLFFVLSIVSIPEMMVDLLGPYKQNSGLTDIAATTVGNLAPRNMNETIIIEMPVCPSIRKVAMGLYGEVFDCMVSRDRLGVFFAGFDVFICLIVLGGFIWIRIFEKQEELLLDKNTVFASMYTLQLKNLPENCTEHTLKHYLLDVMRSRDSSIAAVNIAVDNHDEFRKCVERGDLIKDRNRLINLHRYDTTRIRKRPCKDDHMREKNEKEVKVKRKQFVEKCKAVDKQLQEIDTFLKSAAADRPHCKPIVAFVTFATIHDLEKCLYSFGLKRDFFSMLCQPSSVTQFDGKTLKIGRAPEPSTIIWENLRFSFNERMFRRTVTTLFALLLILVSVASTYVAKYLQDNSTSSSSAALCPDNFDRLSKEQKIDLVNKHSEIVHCYCDSLTWQQLSTDSNCREYYKGVLSMQLVTYFASVIVLLMNVGVEFVMQIFSNMEKHLSEDTAYRSVFLRLFALKYINTSCIFLINSNVQWLYSVFRTKGNSVEFSGDWYRTVGVSIVLVQIGSIATSHTKKFWDYFQYKRLIRIARKRQDSDSPIVLTQDELNKLHEGPVFEFSNNYAQLMTTLYVCMTFSAGMPILYVIGMINFGVTYLVDKYLFINLYKSPNRYSTKIGREATGLVPWAVIVHLVMAIWAFSNNVIFAPSPSPEAEALLSQQPYISPAYKSGQSLKDMDNQNLTSKVLAAKFYHRHTFPLLVLIMIVLLMRGLAIVMERLGYASGQLLGLVFDSGDGEVPHDSVAYVVSYARAVQRNLIKSLATYNILHNIKYKELFQISWEFAFKHSHVRSVRLDKPMHDEQDSDAKIVERKRRNTAFVHSGADSFKAPKISNVSESSLNSSPSNGSSRPPNHDRSPPPPQLPPHLMPAKNAGPSALRRAPPPPPRPQSGGVTETLRPTL